MSTPTKEGGGLETPRESRHRAREAALQALFAMDLQGRNKAVPVSTDSEDEQPTSQTTGEPEGTSADQVFAGVAAHFEMPNAAHDFAQSLVLKVVERRAELDRVIAEHASNWRVERMAVVDRNILRLASWELLFSDTPAPVIIDEAVELARRFGADTTPAFVNGVLDAVAKRAEASP